MIGVELKHFKILLHTEEGDYGFSCEFEKGLNIVRGDNTSGKSTFVNALTYSLGMEQIVGGQGSKVLQYSLKDYVVNKSGSRVKIISSYVFIEISNKKNEIVTFKRSIVSSNKDPKLIEVIDGAYLSEPQKRYGTTPTFVHDKGSAQHNGAGFFSYLESFLGLNLPLVVNAKGKNVKLYLQTIFSALIVEQKRGWTEYIANTPYFAIRDVRTKIVEFLLNLDVFSNERARTNILSEISSIKAKWNEERYRLLLEADALSVNLLGVNKEAVDDFSSNLVKITKTTGKQEVQVYEHISKLIQQIEVINTIDQKIDENASVELVEYYNKAKNELGVLVSNLASINTEISLSKARLSEYQSMKIEIDKSLDENKIALKLKNFGAVQGLEVSKEICPTCHQHFDDSLLLADTLAQPMSIDENVKYLTSQRKMVSNYLVGIENSLKKLGQRAKSISDEIADKRRLCVSIKKDIKASSTVNETDIRRRLELEIQVERLSKAIEKIEASLTNLESISIELKAAQKSLAKLPSLDKSATDLGKQKKFQAFFRKNAGSFGYETVPVSDIEIHIDTLLPYLSGLELREVNTSIRSDSSASDFVRLIWAYLLSLHQVSHETNGNHIGLLVFDEPAQHSMGVTSMNSLLKTMSEQTNLQSIVAASFEESDDKFKEAVEGVSHRFISVGHKLLKPLVN